MLLRHLLLSSLTPLVAVTALLAHVADAHGQSDAGSIELLAVDTDATGNSATSLGEIQVCSSLAVGSERDIDIVVRGVPDVSSDAGGLTGMQFNLIYDERYIEIVDIDIDGQFLAADPDSSLITDFTDDVPSNEGLFTVAAVDFGTDSDESGDGVLARLTIRGVAAGTSDVLITEPMEFRDSSPVGPQDVQRGIYEIATIQNGLIAVGVDCAPNATPPPPPANPRTRTPPPPDIDDPDNGDTDAPNGAVPTNGANGANGTTDDPDGETPRPGETVTPRTGEDIDDDGEDDNGGSSTAIIIALIVTALVLGLAGAGFYALRRRGGTEV